jgi:hypothetical protein
MDLESLNSVLKFGVAVGGICAVLALWTETIINSRKDAVIREMQERAASLEKDAAEARRDIARTNERTERLAIESASQQERAARAEMELERLKIATGPRIFDSEAFTEALKGKPGDAAVILFQPGDPEAENFAQTIHRTIMDSYRDTGWAAVEPRPSEFTHGTSSDNSLALVFNGDISGTDTPLATLKRAFFAAGHSPAISRNSEVAKGFIFIVVGPKR